MAIDLSDHKKKGGRRSEKGSQARSGGLLEFLDRDISLRKGLSDKKKERFFREMGTLFKAGVDMRKALELMEEGREKERDKGMVRSLRERVIGGSSLADALDASKGFGPYEYYSIRIGEESGKLAEVLEELASFFSKRMKLQRQFISVFSYPLFVLLVAFGVVYFMLNNVVPMFRDIFRRFEGELPFLTKKVVGASEWMTANGSYLLIGGALLLLILYLVREQEWARRLGSALLLRMPLFGPVFHKVYLARFCQAMHLLMAGRMPLVDAVDLVRRMVRFYPMERSLEEVREGLVRGTALHIALGEHSVYPVQMVSLIRVGEEVNRLEEMFGKLSEQYSEEVEHSTSTIGSVLEPLLILLIGAFVALIVIAMYLPLFRLSTTIG